MTHKVRFPLSYQISFGAHCIFTTGLLKSSSEVITDHLDSTFSIQKRHSAQYILSLDRDSLELCFLDQRDGKQLLATVTDQLGSAVRAGHLQPQDISVPFLQQKIASTCSFLCVCDLGVES